MHTLTVSQYVAVVNQFLAADMPNGSFEVEGEVSSFGVSGGQWVRFDLKDGESVINCFMPRAQLTEQIADGMKIAVTGVGRIYGRFGKFSINVQSVRLSGEGSLRRAFELLKKKLEAEGFFDATRKRVLPRFPACIALITSRDAAAYTDFLRVSSTRWPACEIVHYHVGVQGDAAVKDVVAALRDAGERVDDFDAIVVTRGGGSLEDLHVFNTEEVARAVFASRVPIVSAVGHERDVTIIDFVADLRAATPSNAAEIIFPDQRDIAAQIRRMTDSQSQTMRLRLSHERARTLSLAHAADEWLGMLAARVQGAHVQLTAQLEIFSHDIARRRDRVSAATRLAQSLHPHQILKRGYSYTRAANGGIIATAAALRTAHTATQVYQDGEVNIETHV